MIAEFTCKLKRRDSRMSVFTVLNAEEKSMDTTRAQAFGLPRCSVTDCIRIKLASPSPLLAYVHACTHAGIIHFFIMMGDNYFSA